MFRHNKDYVFEMRDLSFEYLDIYNNEIEFLFSDNVEVKIHKELLTNQRR